MRWIYILRDPRSGWARYVGCAADLARRLTKHVADARRPDDRSARARWIRGLLAVGLRPEIEAIARVKRGEDPDERERHWIRALLEDGAPLTNVRGGVAAPAKGRRAPRAALALRRAQRDRRVAAAVAEFGQGDRSASPGEGAPPVPASPATEPPAPRPSDAVNRFGHYRDAAGRWRTPRGPRGRGRARRLRSALS